MKIWERIVAAMPWRKPGEARIFISPRQAGENVNEDTALTLPEWWACVSVISRTVAALPWQVFERTDSGRTRIDGSVSWLLNTQPNPEMTAFSFREALMAHVLNWGNGYAELQRDLSGRVVAMWLMTPDRVCPDRSETGALVYKIRNTDGTESVLPASDVFHVHGLGFDGLVGYSVVHMAARSIGLGIAQDTFSGSFYGNGATLGTIVELPARLSPEQIADHEKYYNNSFGGAKNAFRTKVAPKDTKIHQLGMPMTDAQFVESRGMTVTMAARWLGVPPHKIADLTRSTNNNIEHQGIEWVTDGIVPWATRLEQEANIKLIGYRAQGRVYTKMNVNALMRGDSASRAEYYRTMISMGAMSVNEVRELEELNSIGPAGDSHLVQVNQTTLDRLVASPPAPSSEEKQAAAAPSAQPTNVIRAEALDWARAQRNAS